MDPKYYEIGPGWAAFVATFALTVAVIVLFRSLNKHLRKLRLEAAKRVEASPAGPSTKASGLRVEDRDGGGDVVADEATNG